VEYRQARRVLDALPFRNVKPGLGRIQRLLDALNHPESAFPAVHIAGTNGKGSVAAMLSSVLEQSGLRIGRYTSPEIVDFRDRICINQRYIPKTALAEGVAAIRPVLAEPGDTPTLFEALTAIAFSHFARERVDLAVIEVGLGGRFDATNVVRPILTVLTTVGRDHIGLLGDTIPKIAWEKAGIAKDGVPFLIGPLAPEAEAVVRAECASVGASLHKAITIPLTPAGFDWNGSAYSVRQSGLPSRITLPLLGSYQAENLRVVLRAVELLRKAGIEIPSRAVDAGLTTVQWPGRFEVVERSPIVVLDGAHNLPGARALAAAIEERVPDCDRRHLLFGILADKEVEPICRTLLPVFSRVTVTASSSHRALPVEALVAICRDLGVSARFAPTVPAGVAAALGALRAQDVLTIAGSLTLVAEARPLFLEAPCRV
jgi:dihydrofolate synthase / folylpolyglutamate synthase